MRAEGRGGVVSACPSSRGRGRRCLWKKVKSERKKTCNLINFEQCNRVLLKIRILERSSKKHPLPKESFSKYRGICSETQVTAERDLNYRSSPTPSSIAIVKHETDLESECKKTQWY